MYIYPDLYYFVVVFLKDVKSYNTHPSYPFQEYGPVGYFENFQIPRNLTLYKCCTEITKLFL